MRTSMRVLMRLAAAAMAAALVAEIGFCTSASKAGVALAGCPEKCGNVTVPYPFGVGHNCSLNRDFKLTCDKLHSKLLTSGGIEITGIDYVKGRLEMQMPVYSLCFNESVKQGMVDFPVGNAAFAISPKENTFISVGCNGSASLIGRTDSINISIACNKDTGNYCSEVGCCQVDIPVIGWLRELQLTANSLGFNNCCQSFVAKKKWYKYRREDLTHRRLGFNSTPLVVDWAVGNGSQTCESAAAEEGYLCKSHTKCKIGKIEFGYRCKCKEGYTGNPYLPNGCQNIEECSNKASPDYRCDANALCNDTLGSYTCSCPKGYKGDGYKKGTRCTLKQGGINTLLIICTSVSVAVTSFLAVSFFIYLGSSKRRLNKLREQFFHQNGGMLLEKQIAGNEGPSDTRMKIFTLEDLEKATNNFDEKTILGQGGYGTVYKGVLTDIGVVAIKKSKICERGQVEQFINEVVVLSQINHRNVVKLFGCCLETEVPLLVYEFITNGTLYDHLHTHAQSSNLSWEARLRVASESAGALSYLHSAASPPIIHRDVKTANILLDDRLTAKVGDFGASRRVPLDHCQITTLVHGTFGYIDPEYFHTGQLTEKSDVYSFGVVLAELLTGEKAISPTREEGHRNLGAYFVSSLKNGRLSEMVDNRIINDVNFDQVMEVAKIASRCLKVKRDDRPTMQEVAMEIEGLRVLERRLRGGLGENETSSKEIEYISSFASSHTINNVRDSFTSGGKTSEGESMEMLSTSLSCGR
ncbi:unnamed protein product [Cuscuta epithymum]|uniref:Uncharacterized protein n=1 Tax=Cuscuta epithymum TaxID=186058 RepID=A0AAV0FXD9_9ASTE|nr:unnamed protein product [Cuscuta epithymum]